VLDVLDFWLDMGVDGLRLDAVPYLYEREGTNCENLPETHDFLKRSAPTWTRTTTTACCSPRPTSGRRTPWPTSATATSAT
jgi:maltose alpha-D-glucosyltransferase/alpha-amylase